MTSESEESNVISESTRSDSENRRQSEHEMNGAPTMGVEYEVLDACEMTIGDDVDSVVPVGYDEYGNLRIDLYDTSELNDEAMQTHLLADGAFEQHVAERDIRRVW